MKTTLSILTNAALPTIALAPGDHAGGRAMDGRQGMQGHHMAGMRRDMHASMAGKPGDPAKVSRTIEVIMDELKQHAEPNMITLAPGQRGGIVWQFDKPGAIGTRHHGSIMTPPNIPPP